MRRILSFTCIGLIFPFLLSCEKEDIAPSDPSISHVASAPLTISCTTYTYTDKEQNVIDFGTAIGDVILVSFKPWVSSQAQQEILTTYPEFIAISGEFTTETKVISVIRLNMSTSCVRAEQIRSSLEGIKEVDIVLPAFDQGVDENNNRIWYGLTDEIIVLVDSPASKKSLETFAAKNTIKIVNPASEDFFILSVDKRSKGTILEIVSLLNQQAFVIGAEPSVTASPV